MFIKKPVNKSSLANRKPIFGVGINDANYQTQPTINGKRFRCRYYVVWQSMLTRCYSQKFHKTNPTYIECSICKDWLLFSNFKSWMKTQDWKGKHLDKDILIQGNKVYSPDACIFVSQDINVLLTDSKARRGEHPLGVVKDRSKYQARCGVNGEYIHIGCFDSSDDAFLAYKDFKLKLIKSIAIKQDEPLKSALLNYKIKDN